MTCLDIRVEHYIRRTRIGEVSNLKNIYCISDNFSMVLTQFKKEYIIFFKKLKFIV